LNDLSRSWIQYQCEISYVVNCHNDVTEVIESVNLKVNSGCGFV